METLVNKLKVKKEVRPHELGTTPNLKTFLRIKNDEISPVVNIEIENLDLSSESEVNYIIDSLKKISNGLNSLT